MKAERREINACLMPDTLQPKEAEIYQLIRRRHCAQDRDHQCAGTVSMGPKGVTLSCPLCGDAAARYPK